MKDDRDDLAPLARDAADHLDERAAAARPRPDFAAMMARARVLGAAPPLAPVLPLVGPDDRDPDDRADAADRAALAPFTTALRDELDAKLRARARAPIPAPPPLRRPRRVALALGLAAAAAAVLLLLATGSERAAPGRAAPGVEARADAPTAAPADAARPRRVDPRDPAAPVPADMWPAPADAPVPADTSPVPGDTSPVPADTSPVPADTSPVPADTSDPSVPGDTSPVPGDTSASPVPGDTSNPPARRDASASPVPGDRPARPAAPRPPRPSLEDEAQALWQRGELAAAEAKYREVVRVAGKSARAELAHADLFALARQLRGNAGQLDAWRDYLAAFPRGRFADDARAGLCLHAAPEARPACWRDYLERHPSGTHRARAEQALAAERPPAEDPP